MSAPAYETRDLSFSYRPGVDALRGLAFRVPRGAVTAVLGPNGAGKSSLLGVLLGLYRPWRGSVRLLGKPLAAYSRRALSRTVAFVPQREHVPFAFRVEEYILLGRSPYLGLLAQPRPADLEAVSAALSRLGIEALRRREVASLSGGEHQLVLIGRALVQQAEVMLLDEPTAHLDLGNKHHILALLRELAAEGRSVVLTTHDPHIALHLADHVLLLRQGRLLFAGPPDAALTPAHLSALYGTRLRIVEAGGHRFVLPQ